MISALRSQSQIKQPAFQATGHKAEATGPKDGFVAGQADQAPKKPELGDAEKKVKTAPMSVWAKGTLAGMTGLIGLLSLTGCTQQPNTPPVVETQQQKEARQQLSATLNQIEQNMSTLKGSGQAQSEQVTRQIMDAAKTYAKASGQQGPGVTETLRNAIQTHPALVFTTAFALGTAGGIGLEKLGLTDGIKDGVGAVTQAVKDHPLIATGIALAAAGGTAYLIHEMVSTETAIPPKPQGEQAKTLDATFKSLEDKIAANPNVDAKDVNKSVFDAISKYQKDTGKPWEKVADDVKAFAFDHPVLATTLVTTAGVATGVVLEHAGVPAGVAKLVGGAFEGSKDAASGMVNYVKEHPVISGTVAAAVAAGVGYLAYQHFHTPAAPATPTPAN
ncbi:hypothetical protein JST97_14540 [bacterium]|nr:hypothetical protein [bacterium]